MILHQVNQEGRPSSPVRLGLASRMTKNSPSAKWVIAGNLRFTGYNTTAKEALHLLKRLRYYPDPPAALESTFPLSLSVEQDFMYPSSQDDVSQLTESCLSAADLFAFCSCKVSKIDTLQFIARLRFSISHVATVLGRQVLCGESFC